MSVAALKSRAIASLTAGLGLAFLQAEPARQALAVLMSLTGRAEPHLRGPALDALAPVAARLAAEGRLEALRERLRRLNWSLNSESGGIGWGAAEAYAQILAGAPVLMEEFAPLAVAWLDPAGHPAEEPGLLSGALAGLDRLARLRPDLLVRAAGFLGPHLGHADPAVRDLAGRLAGRLASQPRRAGGTRSSVDDNSIEDI